MCEQLEDRRLLTTALDVELLGNTAHAAGTNQLEVSVHEGAARLLVVAAAGFFTSFQPATYTVEGDDGRTYGFENSSVANPEGFHTAAAGLYWTRLGTSSVPSEITVTVPFVAGHEVATMTGIAAAVFSNVDLQEPTGFEQLLRHDRGYESKIWIDDFVGSVGVDVLSDVSPNFTVDLGGAKQSLLASHVVTGGQGSNAGDEMYFSMAPKEQAGDGHMWWVNGNSNVMSHIAVAIHPEFADVTSITRMDQEVHKGVEEATVRWNVQFSEPVAGLSLGNFRLVDVNDNFGSEVFDSFEVISPTEYVITATVEGVQEGSLRLDLANDDRLDRRLRNAQSHNPFLGESYYLDRVQPRFESIERHHPVHQHTSRSEVYFRVEFSETVNLNTGHLALIGDFGVINAPQEDPNRPGTYYVRVSNLNGVTELGLELQAFDHIVDAVDYPLFNGVPVPPINETYVVDTRLPRLNDVRRLEPVGEVTNADQVRFLLFFSKEVDRVDATDFVLTGTAASEANIAEVRTVELAEALGPPDQTYVVTVDGLSDSEGTLGLEIFEHSDIVEQLGNGLRVETGAAWITDEQYFIENERPIPTLPQYFNAYRTNDPILVNVTFSEDVEGFRWDDPIVENAEVATITGGPRDFLVELTPTAPQLDQQIRFQIPEDVVVDDAGNPNAPSSIGYWNPFPEFDFGDAPDTYQTLDASGGPKHVIDAEVFLGDVVPDSESDGFGSFGFNNGQAQGDDNDDVNNIDEDGWLGALSVSENAIPTIQVKVTNESSEAATLAGWIDYDQNGSFDPSEFGMVNVPAGTGGEIVTLEFPRVPTNVPQENTFARLRITTNNLNASTPGGFATDGEVEDYMVEILPEVGADVSVSVDASARAEVGTNFDYVVRVENPGPDSADNVTVTHALPDGSTYVGAAGNGWDCDQSGGVVTCERAELGIGENSEVTITVTAPSQVTTLASTTVVTSTTQDSNDTNNTVATQTTIAIRTPDDAFWFLDPGHGNQPVRREAPGEPQVHVDGGLAVRIGLAQDGTVVVQNEAGEVYARTGSANGIGTAWVRLGSVVAGDGATWFLGPDSPNGTDQSIYRWGDDDGPVYSGGSGTTLLEPVGGEILTRNSAGDAYRRLGSDNGIGTSWALFSETPVAVNLSVSLTEIQENLAHGPNSVTVTATTDVPVFGDQTVQVTVSGTGITAGDYLLSNATIEILDGYSSGTVTFTSINDADLEIRETATLWLTNLSDGLSPGATMSQDVDIRDSPIPDLEFADMLTVRDAFGSFMNFDGDEPCAWDGIFCDEARIVGIVIFGQGDESPPMPSTANLSELITLQLVKLGLTGAAPNVDHLPNLRVLRIDDNQLTGTLDDISSDFSGSNLVFVNASHNELTGPLPLHIFDNVNLQLEVTHNRLTGPFPSVSPAQYRANFSGNMIGGVLPPWFLPSPTGRVDYNMLSADDLNGNAGGGWRGTQTVPPTNIQVSSPLPGTAELTWSPILYQADGGHYEVFSSTTATGPYTSRGTTADSGRKTATGLTVSGLPGGTNYFVVRTFTPSHVNNPNDLTSINSEEVSADLGQLTVSLSTSDSNANEMGDTGTFRLTRDNPNDALTVNLTRNATSTADDTEYELTVGANPPINIGSGDFSVTFPDGDVALDIALTALADANDEAEADETVTLDLAAGDYIIDGSANTGTVTIDQSGLLVTVDSDAGTGSLRQAVLNANAIPGADSITFDNSLATQTITLSSGQLELTESSAANRTTIAGPAGGINVSGNDASRLFSVNSGVFVTIDGLTLIDGLADQGGAILNSGDLTILNSAFRGNVADPAGSSIGGAISNFGPLNVENTLFQLNQGALGGAINSTDGLTISDSNFSGNQSSFNGGALRVFGNTEITGSTFHNNQASNGGGGLINFGTLVMTNSTLDSNSALTGGAIENFMGEFTGTNLTITDNIATNDGGGLLNRDTTTLVNSIVSTNDAPIGANLEGTLEPGSANNLIDVASIDLLLAALADNGGPTMTRALLPGSPAIHAGSATVAPLRDQRGNLRDSLPDIGAYEEPDTLAPTVESVQREGGGDQQSMVREITVQFSEQVNVSAASFEVRNITTNTVFVPDVTTQIVDDKTIAKLTFSGPGIIGGSLPDGDYVFSTLSSSTSDRLGNSLDGNNDTISGDDATASFSRVFGDINGDDTVNMVDFVGFMAEYRTVGTDLLFDFNGDGIVNIIDFYQFRRGYSGNVSAIPRWLFLDEFTHSHSYDKHHLPDHDPTGP